MKDVAKLSGGLAAALVYAIKFYDWRPVPYDLANVADEDTTVGLPLHQIAIRKQQVIEINDKLFSAMDDRNRVALIFHEAVYSLIKPIREGGKLLQPSYDVRRINRYLFEEGGTVEGLKKTVERFGDTSHKFLPVTEFRGTVPDVSGAIIALDRGFHVNGIFSVVRYGIVSTHGAREEFSLFVTAPERKATAELLAEKCASIPEIGGGRVVQIEDVRLRSRNSALEIKPEVSGHDTFLKWKFTSVRGSIKDDAAFKVKRGPVECESVLARELGMRGLFEGESKAADFLRRPRPSFMNVQVCNFIGYPLILNICQNQYPDSRDYRSCVKYVDNWVVRNCPRDSFAWDVIRKRRGE